MDFSFTTKVKGKNTLARIKRTETGGDLMFYDGKNNEFIVEMDEDCFATLILMARAFDGDQAENPGIKKAGGDVSFSGIFHVREDPAALKFDFLESLECPPDFRLSTKHLDLDIGLSTKQFKALGDAGAKVADVFKKVKEIESGKDISPTTA